MHVYVCAYVCVHIYLYRQVYIKVHLCCGCFVIFFTSFILNLSYSISLFNTLAKNNHFLSRNGDNAPNCNATLQLAVLPTSQQQAAGTRSEALVPSGHQPLKISSITPQSCLMEVKFQFHSQLLLHYGLPPCLAPGCQFRCLPSFLCTCFLAPGCQFLSHLALLR